MEVKINDKGTMVDAMIEMINGVMVISPKVEKFEPKDGDVVTTEQGGNLFICKMCTHKNGIYAHIGFSLITGGIFKEGEYVAERFATEEEMRLLFSKLAEQGFEWDAEKKEVVKLKWKPKINEKYYHPILLPSGGEILFETRCEIFKDDIFCDIARRKGWVFRTREECQEFCQKLNYAINSIKP